MSSSHLSADDRFFTPSKHLIKIMQSSKSLHLTCLRKCLQNFQEILIAKQASFSALKSQDYQILFQKSILEKMKVPEQMYSIFFKMRSSRFLTDKSYPNPNFDHEYKIKIVSGSDCYEGFLNQEDMVNLRSDRWTLVQVKQSPTSSK